MFEILKPFSAVGPVSRFPEAPTVHRTPVKVEPLPCFGILKRIVRPDLSRRNKAGHETRLLTVDQSVCAAVPRSPPALNEAKQMNQKGYMRHVVYDVLKPTSLYDLSFVDTTDRIVGHKAWPVRSFHPRLLVVHDVGDFVIVGSHAVLLDVVAPGGERLDSVVRKNRGVRMNDRMVVQFTLVTDRREKTAFQDGRFIQNHQRLVRVARKNDIVKRLCVSVFVLYHYTGWTLEYLSDGPVKVYLVLKASRHFFIDTPRAQVPGLHRGCGFNIEELQIPAKQ